MDTRLPEQRRCIMQAVKSKDTGPELCVRRLLHGMGYRFGQIEIDQLYIGLDKRGCHYVIPVQAKGGKDQIGIVQTTQDIRFVEQKFRSVRCRAIAAQFMEDNIAELFELTLQDGDMKVIEERQYRLMPACDLDQSAIRDYRD